MRPSLRVFVCFFAPWMCNQQYLLLKRLPLSNYFCIFVKIKVVVSVWVCFWDLCSTPLSYVFIAPSAPPILNYCGYVIRLEIKETDSSHFFPLFQICFGNSSLFFHTAFRIILLPITLAKRIHLLVLEGFFFSFSRSLEVFHIDNYVTCK